MIAPLVALLFYALYLGLWVFADAGLYLAAWDRNTLAELGRRAVYNRDVLAERSTDPIALGLNQLQQENEPVDATPPQQRFGAHSQHFDLNLSDCPDQRKLVALTRSGPHIRQRGASTQQLLADKFLPSLLCVLRRAVPTAPTRL